jgi:5-methyltetrahydrofolate--homocysteine methyltransferase
LFGYPAILTDEVVGEQDFSFCGCTGNVSGYFERKETDCQRNLRNFPANQVNDDDIELTDENKTITNFLDVASTISKNKGAPNIALSDFIAPKDNGKVDYGGFLCNYWFCVDECAEFEKI